MNYQQSYNTGNKPNVKDESDVRFCPFQSSVSGLVSCRNSCKLYRRDKAGSGFECPFQELSGLSYHVKMIFQAKNGLH
jgi:hypothetical protein